MLERWPAEDHDVTPLHAVEVVAELVHHDAVADLEGGQHRPRRDVEHLGHVGPHPEGQQQRHGQDHHPLDDPPAGPGAASGRRVRPAHVEAGPRIGARSPGDGQGGPNAGAVEFGPHQGGERYPQARPSTRWTGGPGRRRESPGARAP